MGMPATAMNLLSFSQPDPTVRVILVQYYGIAVGEIWDSDSALFILGAYNTTEYYTDARWI